MDRIKELLGNVQGLSDDELLELRDLVIQALGPGDFNGAEQELSVLSKAITAVQQEQTRRIKLPSGAREAPAEVDYPMPGFGTAERPVTAALPTFV